jgi:hypothetical protein
MRFSLTQNFQRKPYNKNVLSETRIFKIMFNYISKPNKNIFI